MSRRSLQLAGIIRSLIARFTLQIPPTIATGVSITEVRLSPDLQYADVMVGAIDGAEGAVKSLESKRGEIRDAVAKEIQAHSVPMLRFHADARGAEISKLDLLIDSLQPKENKKPKRP